jgi:hypothetical protein
LERDFIIFSFENRIKLQVPKSILFEKDFQIKLNQILLLYIFLSSILKKRGLPLFLKIYSKVTVSSKIL